MSQSSEKDTYFVAVKVFFEDKRKLLVLKDNFGDWDLPGGRIKKDEFEISLHDVVKRKIVEELGGAVEYRLGKPVVMMRHERVEASAGNPTVRIFAIGYEGYISSGEIVLSERHPEMQWVDIATFKPEDYFIGGWLKGVQEYLHMRRV